MYVCEWVHRQKPYQCPHPYALGQEPCTLTAAYTCLPGPICMLVSALTHDWVLQYIAPHWSGFVQEKGFTVYVIISGLAVLPLDVTVQVIDSYFKCSFGEHHTTHMVPTVWKPFFMWSWYRKAISTSHKWHLGRYTGIPRYTVRT